MALPIYSNTLRIATWRIQSSVLIGLIFIASSVVRTQDPGEQQKQSCWFTIIFLFFFSTFCLWSSYSNFICVKSILMLKYLGFKKCSVSKLCRVSKTDVECCFFFFFLSFSLFFFSVNILRSLLVPYNLFVGWGKERELAGDEIRLLTDGVGHNILHFDLSYFEKDR